MGIKPAVELSYLSNDEQNLVYSAIIYEDLTPSHGQSIKISVNFNDIITNNLKIKLI